MVVNIKNEIANATITYTVEDDVITFTATCNDGYIFKSVKGSYIETGDELSDPETITFDKISDTVYEGIAMPLFDNVTATFTGETEKSSTPSKSITNNVNNTTYESTYVSNTYEITLTADTGYVFTDDIICGWTDNVTGETGTAYFTIDADNKTAYIEVTTGEYSDIIINGETIPYEPSTSITNNITNATLSTQHIVGTTVSGILKADDDSYVFIDCFAKFGDTTISLTPTETTDNYIRFVFEAPKGSAITLNGTCRGVCKTVNNTTGCTSVGLQQFYIEGDVVNIVLKADDNTTFLANVPPKFEFDSPQPIYGDTGVFTVSEDKKTATLEYTLNESKEVVSGATFYISGYTLPDTTITGYGSVNVYKVTDEQLEDFANVRFKYISGKDKTLTPDGDFGNYITSLHKIFVPVTDTTSTTIKCGNNDTGIISESINTPTITFDCGECALPSPNGNVTDYICTINVFIPFVGFVKINGEHSGDVLRLVYNIDVVLGNGTYTLFANDVPILKNAVDMKMNVLYRTSNNYPTNTTAQGDNATYLMGLTPYVIYKYYNEVKLPYHTTRKYDNVSNYSGYISADISDFSMSEEVTKTEIDLLLTQLKSGIVI